MAAGYVKAAKEDSWKMLITADTVADRRHVSAGEVISLSVEDALDLMRSGKAQKYVEPPAKPVQEKVEPVKPPASTEVKSDETKDKPKEKPNEATKGGK